MYFNLFSSNKRIKYANSKNVLITLSNDIAGHLNIVYIQTFFRNSAQVQTKARYSEDPPDGEQHGGHLSQAGRLRPRQDLDLERRQLRVPRLYEGRNLKVQTLERYSLLVCRSPAAADRTSPTWARSTWRSPSKSCGMRPRRRLKST